MQNKENNNFWIVYADLMAGLLFVFILLLSAIVFKYVFMQKELKNKQENLALSQNLIISKDELLKSLKDELERINISLDSEIDKNANSQKLIDELQQKNSDLDVKNQEFAKFVDEKDAQILLLLKNLDENKITIENQENELKNLANKLSDFKINYQKLKDNKSKLIKKLQEKLSQDILINLSSGSINLNASILFDSAKFSLKDEAKSELKKTLKKYFDAILSSKEILANIENIVIIGHTDSDGDYIYNLELSQKRALEIMKFINSFYKNSKLEKRLIAVGKSFNEPVMKNGKEDKNASRRIEIKLQFNNNQAIKDFESSIDENSNH